MKTKSSILLLVFSLFFINNIISQEIPAYVKVGTSSKSISELSTMIKDALVAKGFSYKGSYKPEGKSKFKVLAFTRRDLFITCLKAKDRGELAAILKVSLIQKGDKVEVSYLNPKYIFYAYLKDVATANKATLDKIVSDFKEGLKVAGNEFVGFGGTKTASQLQKYHYMMAMPYFTDPIELKTFSSFEEGKKVIENNLRNKKGDTKLVYSLILSKSNIAVYGVALTNKEDGENKFLPIIGEDHIAAMPYEIILQGNKATILHGKYRLALHWPKLTMGEFMKIMSTPGYIEDVFQGLVE